MMTTLGAFAPCFDQEKQVGDVRVDVSIAIALVSGSIG